MIVLGSTDSIRVVTSSANALDAVASFADNTASAFTPAPQPVAIAAAATTTVVSSPAASTQRNISNLSFRAKGGANTITVQFFNGTAFEITSASLLSGDRLEYENGKGWSVCDSSGAVKQVSGPTISGHVIDTNTVALTQRTILNFIDTASVSFAGVDNGVSGASEIRASIIAHAVTAALQTQMPANTIKGEATGALADEQNIAMAVQTALIRSAANIVAPAAAAGQVLGRTAVGGNLGFIVPPGALLRAPQIVTATNAAFAHPTGTNFLVVQGCGGGGAGGGCAAVAGACGSGGNAGNWGMKTFTSISGTSNITIGAGGTGVSGAAGNNGGNSSFVHNAVTLTIPGGIGGTVLAGAATVATATDNAGNAANTGADLSITGAVGQAGYRNAAATTAAVSGDGASGPLGDGGHGRAATAAAGRAGSGFGAGGGGAVAATAATANAGAAGLPSAFIIWEFG